MAAYIAMRANPIAAIKCEPKPMGTESGTAGRRGKDRKAGVRAVLLPCTARGEPDRQCQPCEQDGGVGTP